MFDLNKFFPKPTPAKKGEVNYPFIDRFTLVHFMIGVAYGFLDLGFWWVVLLALAWELIENPMKYYLPFIFPHGTADTLKNSIGDYLAVTSGWAIGRHFIFFHASSALAALGLPVS